MPELGGGACRGAPGRTPVPAGKEPMGAEGPEELLASGLEPGVGKERA